MTLLYLVSKFNTQNINLQVEDGATEETIIKFKSKCIAGVENDLIARTVRKWSIGSSAYSITITVILEVQN